MGSRRAELHSAALFVAIFGFAGAHLAFWPLWLTDWGLTAAEAGSLTAIGVAARVVSGSIIPVLADRLNARRAAVAISGVCAALLFASHGLIETRTTLLVITMLAVGFTAGTFPLGEALGATAARRHSFSFGRARAAGSAAFLVASITLGYLVVGAGIDIVRWWIVATCLLTAAFAIGHPGGGAKIERPSFRDIGKLCTHPVVFLFALAVATGQSGHAVLYAMGSIHWRNLGIAESEIGLLWGASIIVEIAILMLAGTWTTRRFGPVGAVLLGSAVGLFRWIVMCFDPQGVWLYGLQALHGITFGITLLGMIAFITERLSDRFSGSAQALMTQLLGGLFTAGAMALGAWAYPSLGGGAYAISAILTAISMGLCLVLLRRSGDGTDEISIAASEGWTAR